MKFFLLSLSMLTLLFVTTLIVQAQPGLPSPPSQAPIDGGIALLAAAGGAYAYKKLKHRKKKMENNIG